MLKGKYLMLVLWAFVIMTSCIEEESIYDRPDWLTGKIYTQIEEYDDLSTFAECLELTGYDTILDVSGSYTVFAPTNSAFDAYFAENTKYNSINDIPVGTLTEMVKFLTIQNSWTRDQLQSLDIYGWIDEDDESNDKARGFKRQTLLKRADSFYGISTNPEDDDELIIVDSTSTTWHRRVETDSRKYAPFFYPSYFSIYDLQTSDYEFYFDREFDSGNSLYFAGAKIADDTIFAENGFVYKIDKVVEPLDNAYEILSSDNQYKDFLDLVNYFPSLSYDETATFEQEGAEEGLVVDSLFDLTYPNLAFNIANEKTKASTSINSSEDISIRFHHGMIAPTNAAFDNFLSEYIRGTGEWGTLEDVPLKIKRIIANSYLSASPIYQSDIEEGFYNGEDDVITINAENIIDKKFGSNCTFIGVNEPLVPRAFSSITGPVYRLKDYEIVMNAIEYTGLLSALKKQNQDLSFFIIDDNTLRQDSVLFYKKVENNNSTIEKFYAISLAPAAKTYTMSQLDLRILLLNQVAIEQPRGIASVEFLETMSGNHIKWDNINNTIVGTNKSVRGYMGSQEVINTPLQISTNTDNGNTYEVDSWFSFTSTGIYALLNANFNDFFALMDKAGYVLDKEYAISFLSTNKYYTMFIPSDEALAEINADTLTGTNLENFIKLHFIQDDLIFTDGKMAEGYYTTTCTRNIEGTSQTENVEIYIKPGIDYIEIYGNDGNVYTTVTLSDNSNQITARLLSDDDTNYPNIATSGVAHQIDKPFILDLLDTN